jgi:exonuclease III/uncharacterized phage-associated protein
MNRHLRNIYNTSSLQYYLVPLFPTAVKVTATSHSPYVHDHDGSQHVYNIYNKILQYFWSLNITSYYSVHVKSQPFPSTTATTKPALVNKKIIKQPISSPSTPAPKALTILPHSITPGFPALSNETQPTSHFHWSNTAVNHQLLPSRPVSTRTAAIIRNKKTPALPRTTPTQKPPTILYYTHPCPLIFSLINQLVSHKIEVKTIKPPHTNLDPTCTTYPNHAIPRSPTFQTYTNIQIKKTLQHLSSVTQNIGLLEPKEINLPSHNNHTWSQKSRQFKILNFFQPEQTYYLVPTCLFLTLGGDIELNLGPIRNLLRNHPQDHKIRSRTYFTPHTIQIKPEYQHLQTLFEPHLIPTHPQHQATHHTHPFLQRFIDRQTHYPPPIIFYSLIVTISPSLNRCNILLFQPSPLITTLMIRLSLQFPNLEQLTFTTHPYNQFLKDNQELISLPTTIHHKLYAYITQNNFQVNLETTKTNFPFLPDTLITEALKCILPLESYKHPPQNIVHPNIRHTNPEYTNHATYFTTWNISSINTSLPCLQSFIKQYTPAILTLQETKLTSKKSPKYIQRMFPQYKLFFNNTHTPTRYNQQIGTPYTTPRGGLLTFINTKYTYPNNITKIPTNPDISPYLQIIKLNNPPLTPILILNMYMPSHPEDIQLIPSILHTITQQTTCHPTYHIILCGDFNCDIALIGRTQNSNIQPPQQPDYQWRNFTQSLGFMYTNTNTTYTRQGGLDYTHTSLIDGYFTKSPHNIRFTSQTNTNFQQNSDHFPVSLFLPNNIILARPSPPH